MHVLLRKFSSISNLVGPWTEWQFWLTSLVNQRDLPMLNLLKLMLFKILYCWMRQNCMVVSWRFVTWFLCGLLPHEYKLWIIKVCLVYSQVSAKRTNVPGMKQYRGRRPNPFFRSRRPFMPGPAFFPPYGYGWAWKFVCFVYLLDRKNEE